MTQISVYIQEGMTTLRSHTSVGWEDARLLSLERISSLHTLGHTPARSPTNAQSLVATPPSLRWVTGPSILGHTQARSLINALSMVPIPPKGASILTSDKDVALPLLTNQI